MSFSISGIIEGWSNHLIPKEELKEKINEVAEYRLSICRECPMFSENRKVEDPSFHTKRKDQFCTECGCPIKPKVKALSKGCPLDKWGPATTATEESQIKDL